MEILESVLKGSSKYNFKCNFPVQTAKEAKLLVRLESKEIKPRLKQTKENTFPSKHITKFRTLLPHVTVEAKMTNVL